VGNEPNLIAIAAQGLFPRCGHGVDVHRLGLSDRCRFYLHSDPR
jgi:hypothetical protein